ncbi:MAG TPA: hypothetical protein VN253_22010, partial [Kofleriaceae bacterium]|nr:hypothetical protein [Kofleriaceae bacterium]
IAPGFPSKVTTVQVVRQGTVVASQPVAADGSFQISVPPSKGLSLQVVGAGKSGVVFPRQSGTAVAMHTTFSVRKGSAPFNLGQVRYVGNLSSTPIAFHNGPAAGTDCAEGKDADGKCCIDDDDDQDDGTCEADDGEGDDDGDGQTGTPPTGTPPTGTPPTTGGGPVLAYEGDAVAEHNVPADGCHDDDENDDDQGEDHDGNSTGGGEHD